MSLLDFIRCGVVSNLVDANANPANSANDGAIEALAYLRLAKLAGLAVATSISDTAKDGEI